MRIANEIKKSLGRRRTVGCLGGLTASAATSDHSMACVDVSHLLVDRLGGAASGSRHGTFDQVPA